MLVEQLARHQDEAGRTEAALERGALDERFLDHIEGFAGFDGRNLRSLGQGRQVQAPGHRRSVHQHGAAAAQPLAAAFARAVQAERIAQHLDQRLVRGDLRRDRLAVERESNFPSHLPCKAMNTISGLIGSSVSRTPTASWIALAIAGDTEKVAVSPTPLPPKGPVPCTELTASL